MSFHGWPDWAISIDFIAEVRWLTIDTCWQPHIVLKGKCSFIASGQWTSIDCKCVHISFVFFVFPLFLSGLWSKTIYCTKKETKTQLNLKLFGNGRKFDQIYFNAVFGCCFFVYCIFLFCFTGKSNTITVMYVTREIFSITKLLTMISVSSNSQQSNKTITALLKIIQAIFIPRLQSKKKIFSAKSLKWKLRKLIWFLSQIKKRRKKN